MAMSVSVAWGLLAMHFVGDFLLQSDWMATNKSKRWDALALHVCAYTLPFVPFLLIVRGDAPVVAQWLLLNAALHFGTDAVTSRITSRLFFLDVAMPVMYPRRREPHGQSVAHFAFIPEYRHWFFVAIGADQLLHFTMLGATWLWLFR